MAVVRADAELPAIVRTDPVVPTKVVCRVRPLNYRETLSRSQLIIKHLTDESLEFMGKTFQFDRVFHDETSQETVYIKTALPVVKEVLSGFNCTIFAFGQTSAGKTHTMEGVLEDTDQQGIIPRIARDIFHHITTMDENVKFDIKISCYELYMDKVRDLLDVSKSNLEIHEDKNRVPYIKDLTERLVASPDEVMAVITESRRKRHISSTDMNLYSSRSHAVFLLHVTQRDLRTQKTLTAKLSLVDLAGGEKPDHTGANKITVDQAKSINKSLSMLNNVVAALSSGKNIHVPYRNAKLTRILQQTLGGNAMSMVILCISPSSLHEAETKSTLSFGVRAAMIKKKVVINLDLPKEEWKRLYEKERDKAIKYKLYINKLEAELKRKGEETDHDEPVSETMLHGEVLPLAPEVPEVITIRDDQCDIIEFDGNQVAERFEGMGLEDALLARLRRHKFRTPTAFQQRAVVPCIMGRNVIGVAGGEAGKTLAFIISILHKIDTANGDCQALMLTPDGRAASQVQKIVMSLGDYIDVQCHACIGGSKDVVKLGSGQHVVVGTPSRVNDMIQRKALNTEALKVFVLDRADEMLSKGFKDNVYDIFQSLPGVQMLLSAVTMLADVQELTECMMDDPVRVVVQKDDNLDEPTTPLAMNIRDEPTGLLDAPKKSSYPSLKEMCEAL